MLTKSLYLYSTHFTDMVQGLLLVNGAVSSCTYIMYRIIKNKILQIMCQKNYYGQYIFSG
jgi:hypothetical protein